MLALLAQFDKAGNRHTGSRKAQHRMVDEGGLERRDGKTQSDPEEAERDDMGHDLPAKERCAKRAGRGRTTAAQSAGSRSAVK